MTGVTGGDGRPVWCAVHPFRRCWSRCRCRQPSRWAGRWSTRTAGSL